MGSWQYAFMFPGGGEELRPGGAVTVLSKGGFEFESKCYGAVVVDSEGHLEYTEEMALSGDPVEELNRRLNEGEQLSVQCGNRDLFLMLSSGVRYQNPHMVLAWSRRLFESLSQRQQGEHLSLVRGVASSCGAKYVVVVNDVPDGFEDNLVEVDGHPILDRYRPSGREYDIFAAWVRNPSTASRGAPSDVPVADEVGEGFSEWVFE